MTNLIVTQSTIRPSIRFSEATLKASKAGRLAGDQCYPRTRASYAPSRTGTRCEKNSRNRDTRWLQHHLARPSLTTQRSSSNAGADRNMQSGPELSISRAGLRQESRTSLGKAHEIPPPSRCRERRSFDLIFIDATSPDIPCTCNGASKALPSRNADYRGQCRPRRQSNHPSSLIPTSKNTQFNITTRLDTRLPQQNSDVGSKAGRVAIALVTGLTARDKLREGRFLPLHKTKE